MQIGYNLRAAILKLSGDVCDKWNANSSEFNARLFVCVRPSTAAHAGVQAYDSRSLPLYEIEILVSLYFGN